MTKTKHPEALTHRKSKAGHDPQSVARSHTIMDCAGLCDEQLRQLGERWCDGLHTQIVTARRGVEQSFGSAHTFLCAQAVIFPTIDATPLPVAVVGRDVVGCKLA